MRRHGEWADRRLLDALRTADTPAALRECAHIRGAQETWASRIQQRQATLPVWPELTLDDLARVAPTVDATWAALLDGLRDADLAAPISYRSLAGEPFTTPLGEILTHVMLHGQYHRGKANAALRAVGTPVTIDYIIWQRSLEPTPSAVEDKRTLT